MQETTPQNPNPLKNIIFTWQPPQPFLQLLQIPFEIEVLNRLQRWKIGFSMYQLHAPIKTCAMCS